MEFVAIVLVIFLLIYLQNVVYKKYGFKNLEYHCYLNTNQAVEGDEIEIIEEITNGKWLPLAWFKAEITTSKYLDFAGAQSVVTDQSRFVPSFFMLKSYQKVVRRWKVTCLKRGNYKIHSVTLVSTDLLGNVSLSQAGVTTGNLLVLPKPLMEEELTTSPRFFTGDIVVKRNPIEDPFEISGVREYTGVESMRDVNWASTARVGRLMVYQKDSTSKQSIATILNLQPKTFGEIQVVDKNLIEIAFKVCAGVFEQTLKTGMPVRFYCNSSVDSERETLITSEHWGMGHVESLMQILARLPVQNNEDFALFLKNVMYKINATDIFVVTCYIDEDMLNFAREMQWKGSTVKFLLLGKHNLNFDGAREFVIPLSHLIIEQEKAGEQNEND